MNKKLLLTFIICIYTVLQINSQTNKQIANAYIKRANDAIEKSIDYTTACANFENALKYMDVITDAKVASLGARTYYEIYHKQRTIEQKIQFLETSNKYSKQYFDLAENKNSNEYATNLEIFNLSKKAIKKLKYSVRKNTMRKF
jgi:GTP-sensing pleiotropic transcriptional regulator CodY